MFVLMYLVEKMYFKCPRANVTKLWQYLLLQLNSALPNLTLPNKFNIPIPDHARGSHVLPQSFFIP